MNKEEIRIAIANIYWSLKKDSKALWEQGEDREVFFDVGICIGYCHAIKNHKLGYKIYDRFMNKY